MRLRRRAGDDQEIDDRQQRPQPRAGLRQDHREEGHARRVAAAAGVLRARRQGQADAAARRDQGPAGLDPDRDPRHAQRQDALASEADPGRAPEAARRRAGAREAHLRARRGAPHRSSTSTSPARRATSPSPTRWRRRPWRRKPRRRGQRRPRRTDEACLLARLRIARLHHRAARLDGAGRRAARDRAGHARPRQLLRRRRDRRAQPGARRHAQRPHLRARPADRAAR